MSDRPAKRKRKPRRTFTAADIERFRAQYAIAPDEAAAIAGVDPATFYRRVMPYVRGGAIVSFKIGTCRRIVVESLLAFWAEHGGAS